MTAVETEAAPEVEVDVDEPRFARSWFTRNRTWGKAVHMLTDEGDFVCGSNRAGTVIKLDPEATELTCNRCAKRLDLVAAAEQSRPVPKDLGALSLAGTRKASEYNVSPCGEPAITLGELLALIQEHKASLDVNLPVRALGRFDSESTLGAMVSEDGTLCLMGID